MSAAAEVYAEHATGWQTAEYALSVDRLRTVGQLALAETVDVAELTNSTTQLRAEFDTSLSEMLKSDVDFGKELEITRFESYEVSEGHVVSHDGHTPVVSMLQNGYNFSTSLAQKDPRMWTQADRDRHDLRNAHEVDAMISGKRGYNTRIVASLLPEEAIERDGAEYWRGMGYFPDTTTAFFQLYHVTHDGELITGTLSVDAADKESMRKLWAEAGQDIPDNESTDNWLQYALTDHLTTAQAKALVKQLRQKHYQNVGHTPARPTSVEEVLQVNADVVDQSFDQLQLPLSESTASNTKTQPIQQLVAGFLQKSHQLDAKTRANLIRTANRSRFDDTDARLVYKLIMYATAEEIRKSLPLAQPVTAPGARQTKFDRRKNTVLSVHPARVPEQVFMNQIIQSAFVGVAQNRSYAACGASIKINGNDNPNGELATGLNLQDAFGGKAEAKENAFDEDRFGPLTFECTEGHTNRRPHGKKIDKCQHRGCTGSVGCD